MNKVKFDKKWFNPLYFILNNILKDSNVRTVLVYGGKSSAKTLSLCQILEKEAVLYEANSICFRKESVTIKTTLKESFKKAMKTTRLSNGFTTMEFSFRGYNGSEIVLKGLDDEEKGKGIESFKYLFLDELNQFLLSEYEQLQMSLRGIEGQKVFTAWNPVDINSWVKTDLIDTINWIDTDKYGVLPCEYSFIRISDDGKTVLIKTSYPDNYWIVGSPCGTYGYRDENLIGFYERMKERNYNSYKVNVLGEWGKTDYGGEFVKKWRSEIHVEEKPYKKGLAVRLVFDENVNPYFPCGVFQVEDIKDAQGNKIGHDAWMCKHFALSNPDNTVKAMCKEIDKWLSSIGHKEAVYIGGDATSQKDDVKQEKGYNLFVLIANELQKYRPRLIVTKSNPSVRISADFFNDILEFEECRIRYRVDSSCKTAITDYENTKEGKNGEVDKKTVKDPATKVTYQPYGHFVDLTRYFLVQTFESEYYEYQNRGVSTGLLTRSNNKHRF
jgi:flavodoxin